MILIWMNCPAQRRHNNIPFAIHAEIGRTLFADPLNLSVRGVVRKHILFKVVCGTQHTKDVISDALQNLRAIGYI